MKRINLFGYSIHQSLMVLPLAMLSCAIWFDVIYLATAQPLWGRLAFWMISGGLITAFLSAPFGWYDYFTTEKESSVRRIQLGQGLSNTLVVILFAVSWFYRRGHVADPNYIALTYSFAGAAVTVVASWLGGELAERMGWDEAEVLAHPSSARLLADNVFLQSELYLRPEDPSKKVPAALLKKPNASIRHGAAA